MLILALLSVPVSLFSLLNEIAALGLLRGDHYVEPSARPLPEQAQLVDRIVFPALPGELWIILWLLIKGAKVPELPTRPRGAALDPGAA
jgi:hypothetical protein